MWIAGLVYQSDAQGSTKVKVVTIVPASSYKPIAYPAAVILATKNKQVAEDFLNYLESSEAQQVFVRNGFKTLRKIDIQSKQDHFLERPS